MAALYIEPLGNRVLLKAAEKQTMYGRVVLPDSVVENEDSHRATVLAIGPGVEHVQAGAEVLISKYGGTKVEVGEFREPLVLMFEQDVLAKLMPVGDVPANGRVHALEN